MGWAGQYYCKTRVLRRVLLSKVLDVSKIWKETKRKYTRQVKNMAPQPTASGRCPKSTSINGSLFDEYPGTTTKKKEEAMKSD